MKREQKIPVGPGGGSAFQTCVSPLTFTVQQSASLPAARPLNLAITFLRGITSSEENIHIIINQLNYSSNINVFNVFQ
jgi:hypothetical protein